MDKMINEFIMFKTLIDFNHSIGNACVYCQFLYNIQVFITMKSIGSQENNFKKS